MAVDVPFARRLVDIPPYVVPVVAVVVLVAARVCVGLSAWTTDVSSVFYRKENIWVRNILGAQR